MIYSEKVMDHYANPRNVGEIEDANGVGEVGNAKCGDIMKMYLKIEDNTIKDVKFKTFGCGAAIATSSIATEMIKGKPLSEALKLTNKAVVEALDGLPPVAVYNLIGKEPCGICVARLFFCVLSVKSSVKFTDSNFNHVCLSSSPSTPYHSTVRISLHICGMFPRVHIQAFCGTLYCRDLDIHRPFQGTLCTHRHFLRP